MNNKVYIVEMYDDEGCLTHEIRGAFDSESKANEYVNKLGLELEEDGFVKCKDNMWEIPDVYHTVQLFVNTYTLNEEL